MRIYVAHAKKMDYVELLYNPLREDEFFNNHELILPHEHNDKFTNTRDFYKTLDMFIADCSEPATGLGIELGWAYDDGIDIYAIIQSDKRISNSIRAITNNFYRYDNSSEIPGIIKEVVKKRELKK